MNPHPAQVLNDVKVNLGERNEVISWDDDNESNDFVDNPFKDDVKVDEDALATNIILCNIPTIVAPTPYALVPPLDHEFVEDNSWRSWACNTTNIEEGGGLKRV